MTAGQGHILGATIQIHPGQTYFGPPGSIPHLPGPTAAIEVACLFELALGHSIEVSLIILNENIAILVGIKICQSARIHKKHQRTGTSTRP